MRERLAHFGRIDIASAWKGPAVPGVSPVPENQLDFPRSNPEPKLVVGEVQCEGFEELGMIKVGLRHGTARVLEGYS
jgi:hypothetical protein